MLTIKAVLRSLGEKLLDKADFDLKDYGDRGGFYTPKSKVQMDKSLLNHQRKPIRIPAYLTIIPRAQMGSELIAHEAKGRNGLFTQRPWGREE